MKEPGELEADGRLPRRRNPHVRERRFTEGDEIADRDALHRADDPKTAGKTRSRIRQKTGDVWNPCSRLVTRTFPRNWDQQILAEALGPGAVADQVVTVASAGSKSVSALTTDEMEDARRASAALRVRLSGLFQAAIPALSTRA